MDDRIDVAGAEPLSAELKRDDNIPQMSDLLVS